MPLQKAQELRQPSRRNYLCLDQAPAARPCLLFEAAGTAGQACAARLATAHAAAPPAPAHQRHCFAQLAQGRPKHTSGTKSSERRDLELGLSVGGLQLVQPSSPARPLLLSAQLLQIRHVLQRPHHRASVFPGSQSPAPNCCFPLTILGVLVAHRVLTRHVWPNARTARHTRDKTCHAPAHGGHSALQSITPTGWHGFRALSRNTVAVCQYRYAPSSTPTPLTYGARHLRELPHCQPRFATLCGSSPLHPRSELLHQAP